MHGGQYLRLKLRLHCARGRDKTGVVEQTLRRIIERPTRHLVRVDPRLKAADAADPQDPAYNQRIAHKGIWVEPESLAEIEYRAKSAVGKVRHPFFKGIREGL